MCASLQVTALTLTALLAGAKGWHMTSSIGGADMPVVITLLNSYSGARMVACAHRPSCNNVSGCHSHSAQYKVSGNNVPHSTACIME